MRHLGADRPVEPAATTGSSGFRYAADADVYSYAWKTEKGWEGSCRQLVVTLDDASVRVASFSFH